MIRRYLLIAGVIAGTAARITRAQSASQQSASQWMCKDATIVPAADKCVAHGGGGTEVHAATPNHAPAKSAAARCKDGTTEFYADKTSTCDDHGGTAFTFPASGLTDKDRVAAEKTDSIRTARRARCAADSTKCPRKPA